MSWDYSNIKAYISYENCYFYPNKWFSYLNANNDDDADDVALGNINDANVFDISSGEATSEKTSIEEDSLEEDTISTGEVSNNVDEEKKEEGSDLTKFFG